MRRVLHVARRQDLVDFRRTGEYVPPMFEQEGFIHCSYPSQVIEVANRIFRGQRDLVLMEIDVDALSCRVVDENLEGGSELYPHIYGRLPLSAVAAVHPFPCGPDERFELPVAIRIAAPRT